MDNNSLAHTKWECKYHIVFAPKYHRQVIYKDIKTDVVQILGTLCRRKGIEIIEAQCMPDHIHMMVIIDELDAKLHPKLLRYVIFLFKNKEINKHGAQLLFTSHDMYTLKNTVFRRDEIWFAAETVAHESELYSLHEIRGEDNDRIKNTAAYDKQYLEGRYGAAPYLSNMLGGDFALV